METSDSEYFESADEDFELEDKFNKIQILGKGNQVEKSNTLSDVNQNKENTSAVDVSKDNKIIIQSPDFINNVTSETLCKESLNDDEANKKITIDNDTRRYSTDNNFWNEEEGWGVDDESEEEKILPTQKKDDFTKILSTGKNTVDEHENTPAKHMKDDETTRIFTIDDDTKQHNTDDNLWNEEEGWGVDDESEEEKTFYTQNKVNATKILSTEKNTNDEDVSSKEDNLEKRNKWESKDWQSVTEKNIQENEAKSETDNSSNQVWKGWSNWGVTSILSTATHSVSTLTNSVSQGLSSVLETSIGAPDPEKLAMLNQTEQKSSLDVSSSKEDEPREEQCENRNILGFGLTDIGNLVSGVSKLVETTGTKVISGGLDTLETIGKKTMEVIQDGDPGLKRKRAFLNLEGEKPVLSQVLREAKEKTERENEIRQEKHSVKKVNYESIFDDHQGLVHLEALEMLSKQCDMKLELLIESRSGSALTEIQETLDQVKELCELPDEEEDEQISSEELKERLQSAVEEIGVNITYEKLIAFWQETECWLNNVNLSVIDENEVHQQAIQTLAQLTALAVEQFHKAGELLLIKDHHSTADEADSLVQLTTTLSSLIDIVAAKFSEKMNNKAANHSDKEQINSLITNIFLEAANSSSYIQDAFQLLVPVLQMGAV